MIALETIDDAVPDEKAFLVYVDLCKALFSRFDFVFGTLQNRDEGPVRFNMDHCSLLPPGVVNFYSRGLAEKIGREKILWAPAYRVEDLENSGIMWLVCSYPEGCHKELRKAEQYLCNTPG